MTTKVEGTSWSTTHDETQKTPRIEFDQVADENITPILTINTLFLIALISIFAVFSHWNFWSVGQYSVGWNSSAYWIGVIFLLHKKNPYLSFRKDWAWVIPIMLIVTSFSLFENPWLKLISIIVLPLFMAFFYNFGQLKNNKNIFWDRSLLLHIDKKALSPIVNISGAMRHWAKHLSRWSTIRKTDHSKRILKGFLLLIPSAVLVILLLSSADNNFSQLIESVFEPLLSILSLPTVFKILFSILFSVFLLAVLFSWRLRDEFNVKIKYKQADSIVYGILMSGILVVYMTFLYLQLEYVLIDSLPIDFEETENIVKSGFWQLFFLSILNVILFVSIYKKTTKSVQLILRIYIFASGLILLSACWRIGLYVYWYGLSYEKYFASYTCIFALFTFLYLLRSTFARSRMNIVRFLALSILWFYAIATISPVEKIIYNTNHYLAKQENSRLNLIHLRFLSADILADVERDISNSNLNSGEWKNWLILIKSRSCNRQWYETNLSLILNCTQK